MSTAPLIWSITPREPGVYLLKGEPLTRPTLLGITDKPLGVSLWALDPAREHMTLNSVSAALPEMRYARLGDLPDNWRDAAYDREYPAAPGHYLMAVVGAVVPVTLVQLACPRCQPYAPCLGGVRFLRLSDIRAAHGSYAGWLRVGDLGAIPKLPAKEKAA